jgi:uncharacterized protein (TIGR00159 family)
MDWLAQVLQRPPIEWVDLLDIAIVAVLVYEVLVLIKGTRAMQIALSGGFIIALYFLSEWLGLETVNWLIRNMAVYGVFAIIVLLQTDIRRALAHFGRAPLFRYLDRSTNLDEAIEELVISVANLSARKIGALIAIERRIGLRNYIEGGIPLDATISYDLLASIFQVASPLHDGAVIVQGDRIAAAACFLPLSVNPEGIARARHPPPGRDRLDRGERLRGDRRLRGVGRDLAGARWRARARAYAGHAAGQAARAARAATPGAGARRRWGRRELGRLMAFNPFRRLGLKVVSVVLAALIWLVVSGEQIVERGFRIPLEFSNLPSGLELATDAPTVVDVRVRGSSGALSRLTPGELVAILDLRQAKAGQRLFHMTGGDVRAPFGIDVVLVTPSSLAITFEPSASKQVTVSPVVEGQPAAGSKCVG